MNWRIGEESCQGFEGGVYESIKSNYNPGNNCFFLLRDGRGR